MAGWTHPDCCDARVLMLNISEVTHSMGFGADSQAAWLMAV